MAPPWGCDDFDRLDYHTAQSESFCASLSMVTLAVAPLGDNARPIWRWDPATVDALTTFNETDSAERRGVARLIAQHTPADSTLLVWGFEPILHEWSQRRPASRFFMNQPLRTPWYQARARELFLQDIGRHLPHAIVVVHGDVLTVVTGNNDDSAAALAKFKPMADLVAKRYARVATQGRFEVFALRSGKPEASRSKTDP